MADDPSLLPHASEPHPFEARSNHECGRAVNRGGQIEPCNARTDNPVHIADLANEVRRLGAEVTGLTVVAEGLGRQRDAARAVANERGQRVLALEAELAGVQQMLAVATAPNPHEGELHLPPIPAETVALTGKTTGTRYIERPSDYHDGRRVWQEPGAAGWWGDLGELLSREPHGLNVELPPKPTAAQVWKGLPASERTSFRAAGYAELADALDREVGTA